MCSLYHLVNMGLKLQTLLKYVPKVRHVYSVCTYYVCTALRKSRVHDKDHDNQSSTWVDCKNSQFGCYIDAAK